MKQLVIAAALVGLSLSAAGADPNGIAVTGAWLRATPNGAKVAGGYATITNSGTTQDHLIGASIPSAASGEIHAMTMENGVMHMSRMEGGLAIAPGATMTLKPGGYHMMFMNPTAPLKEGQTVTGTLTFEKAGTVQVTFAVAGMAAKSAPGAMGAMDMGGMKTDGTKAQ